MSGEAPVLVHDRPVSPQASNSPTPHTERHKQASAAVMPGRREPCVGQEASNSQKAKLTSSTSGSGDSTHGNSVNRPAPLRVGQSPDGAGTGSGNRGWGTRPAPQGAPSQVPGQVSSATPIPATALNNAMAAVVKGSMTAAVVGLVRPLADNGSDQAAAAGTSKQSPDQVQNTKQLSLVNDPQNISRSVSFTGVTTVANGHGEDATSTSQKENSDEFECEVVELRKHPVRGHLRHAHSEAESSDLQMVRRRSQTMTEMKEHAYGRLQEELSKAQTDLRLKDEEVEKLSKVRDQMEQELDDLTASLFEEANKMVQEANVKRMHTEKLLAESNQKIEVLEAEVVALKQLVLTSTPSSPNKHLHPQIAEPKEKKVSKPFWKTHRRSTSHHEFTKESRQAAEAQQAQAPVHCKDFDAACYDQFLAWRHKPEMDRTSLFLARMIMEDISPCLNFSNRRLAERVQHCVEENTLTIEPIPGDNSYPRKCSLTESNKLCNYKIKLGDDSQWYSISQMCRNRIAAVCDFYTYVRYIHQGLVRNEEENAYKSPKEDVYSIDLKPLQIRTCTWR